MDRRRPGLRAVVDTNVIAYLLLGTSPFADEVGSFWRQAQQTQAPAIWEAELANVLWMAFRAGVISADGGRERLRMAGGLGIDSVPSRSLWEGALVRSFSSGVSVYDTLFVELASREQLRLATFDAKLLAAFPDIAARPASLA